MSVGDAYVHTPLGFDITNPLSCISAVLSVKRLRIRKVYLYVPDKEDPRNKKALEDVEVLIKAMGMDVDVTKLPFKLEREGDFISSVFNVYKKMMEGEKIITCLGGGMRQIVLVLFSASLMISNVKDVEIFIQPEEKGVGGTFISGRVLKLIAAMARDKDIIRQILLILASKKEGMRLQDIYKELSTREGAGVSRTTVHNHLRNLVSQGIIREIEGGYYTIY